jgi:hypothetical protein
MFYNMTKQRRSSLIYSTCTYIFIFHEQAHEQLKIDPETLTLVIIFVISQWITLHNNHFDNTFKFTGLNITFSLK